MVWDGNIKVKNTGGCIFKRQRTEQFKILRVCKAKKEVICLSKEKKGELKKEKMIGTMINNNVV